MYSTFCSTPTLSCLLCGQGAHDKCLNEMLEEDGVPKLPGLVWMSPFCEKRGTVGDLKGNKQLLKGQKNDSKIEPINVDQENVVNTKEDTDKKNKKMTKLRTQNLLKHKQQAQPLRVKMQVYVLITKIKDAYLV